MVGLSSKLGILEAFWPQIFFPSQSTIVREDVYQKSAMCLHLDSRDTTLNILKNPLISYTWDVVSPLIRVSQWYQICIFQLFLSYFSLGKHVNM